VDWEQRLRGLWETMDDHTEQHFRANMDQLVAELPAGSAIGLYERASALDSTGHADLAVPLYRLALAIGLAEDRRRQAVIQLASSLRNLGHASESVQLLMAERETGSDDLDDAVSAFLALALVDSKREREAVSVALTALSRHMTRYQRSLSRYAERLVEPK
jgi:Tetratrico peptide repeat